MLTNSIVAGALVGAYVTLLVLQLNPAVPLNSLGVVRLVMTWWVFYEHRRGAVLLRAVRDPSTARGGREIAHTKSSIYNPQSSILVYSPYSLRAALRSRQEL
jgi:hypothetical protein